MKEEITLKISKNDLVKLLEKHYENKLGKKIKISITTTKEYVGFYETEEIVTRIKFETKETMMDEVFGKIDEDKLGVKYKDITSVINGKKVSKEAKSKVDKLHTNNLHKFNIPVYERS